MPIELELICNPSILSYEKKFLERGNYQQNYMKNQKIISFIFESFFKEIKPYRNHTVQVQLQGSMQLIVFKNVHCFQNKFLKEGEMNGITII